MKYTSIIYFLGLVNGVPQTYKALSYVCLFPIGNLAVLVYIATPSAQQPLPSNICHLSNDNKQNLFCKKRELIFLLYFLYLFYSSWQIYLSWNILMKFLFSINDMMSNKMYYVGFCIVTMIIEIIHFLISNKIKVVLYLIFLKKMFLI